MNILLVDDDYILAKSTAKLLERLGGHQVHITGEPAEIFQQCEAGVVDLVMMDVNLAGAQWEGKAVSGADVSYILKTQHQTAHIPIILVTAYAMLSEQKTLLATSRADKFCAKPITDYEALLEFIAQLGQVR